MMPRRSRSGYVHFIFGYADDNIRKLKLACGKQFYFNELPKASTVIEHVTCKRCNQVLANARKKRDAVRMRRFKKTIRNRKKDAQADVHDLLLKYLYQELYNALQG